MRAFNDNILIDKLYNLQLSLINNNRHNILHCFLPYKIFISLKKFKNKLVSFNRPFIYCFPYDSLYFLPEVTFTSVKHEDNETSPFPQLVFQSLYFNFFFNSHIFFTDASKSTSPSCVGAAFYSLSLNLSKLYKIDSFASIITGKALVIFHALQFILKLK